eukprot:2008710-Pyramimonas_sp.AAC.1
MSAAKPVARLGPVVHGGASPARNAVLLVSSSLVPCAALLDSPLLWAWRTDTEEAGPSGGGPGIAPPHVGRPAVRLPVWVLWGLEPWAPWTLG